MNFIVHTDTGSILRSGQCSQAEFLLQALDGEFVIEGIANPNTQIIINGEVVDKPPVIVILPDFNLAQAQLKKLDEINQAYDRANTSSFIYLGVIYNADSIAQNNINSTANYINQFNTFPDDWLGVWVADDGSILPMTTTADFWPLYKAYVAQGVYNIAHFSQLKAEILALPETATQADLDAIQW